MYVLQKHTHIVELGTGLDMNGQLQAAAVLRPREGPPVLVE